jgi:hypothetical protein
MAIQLANGKNQYFASDGSFLDGGKLYAFVAGTSTPKNTYTTSGAGTPHSHPMVLNARGEVEVYWSGVYDVYLTTSADAPIWGPVRLEEGIVTGDLSVSGNATIAGTLAVAGAVSLGDAQADTLSIGGSVYKSAAGNWVFPAPSTGDTLTVGQVGANAGLVLSASLAGGTVLGYVLNGSNTANSEARFRIQNGGTSGGDAVLAYLISSGQAWSSGTDVSDSSAYKISASAALGTTDALVITTDRRIYGLALHNNAGAVTGTTNQYIASGTYVPTFVSVSNITGTPSGTAQWTRVGNVVTVSGSVQVDPTTASTASSFTSTLPIASTFGSIADLAGTAVRDNNTAANICASIRGSSTIARFDFFCDTNVNSEAWYYTFTYEVL